jgi:hypothetical protein
MIFEASPMADIPPSIMAREAASRTRAAAQARQPYDYLWLKDMMRDLVQRLGPGIVRRRIMFRLHQDIK